MTHEPLFWVVLILALAAPLAVSVFVSGSPVWRLVGKLRARRRSHFPDVSQLHVASDSESLSAPAAPFVPQHVERARRRKPRRLNPDSLKVLGSYKMGRKP